MYNWMISIYTLVVKGITYQLDRPSLLWASFELLGYCMDGPINGGTTVVKVYVKICGRVLE